MALNISPKRNQVWMWIWGVTSLFLIGVVIYTFTIGDKPAGFRMVILAFLSLAMFTLRYKLHRQVR